MEVTYYLFLVIAVTGLLQCVFGMGLLVFGTPSFLLLEYSFPSVLSTLLPASMILSVVQVYNGEAVQPFIRNKFWLWGVPFLIISLTFVLLSSYRPPFHLLVAAGLILGVVLARSEYLQQVVRSTAGPTQTGLMVGLGIVYGLSNLGGSVLGVIASSTSRSKQSSMATVAYCYLFLALVQTIILAVLNHKAFGTHSFFAVATVTIVYDLVGRRIYSWVNDRAYQGLFHIFMFVYAFAMIISWYQL